MAWGRWLGIFITGLLIALGARCRWLRPGGALALALSAILIFWFGNWPWGLVLCAYWLSALLLARYRKETKQGLGDLFAWPRRLGWLRVVAWCGWPVALVLFDWLQPGRTALYAGYVGALAAAAADTWSTELGVLNFQSPRMITTGRRVPPGTSGATSPLGLVASIAGAWLIGITGLFAHALASLLHPEVPWNGAFVWLPLAAALGGFVGALLDSFFGATAQGIYYCEQCKTYTEERLHSCGAKAQQVRGWAWLTNDGVNLVSSLVGAAISAALVAWLARSIL